MPAKSENGSVSMKRSVVGFNSRRDSPAMKCAVAGVILISALSAQTLLDPRQIFRSSQISPGFFQHCQNGAVSSLGSPKGTQARFQQVRKYGLWIDGKRTLHIWRPIYEPLAIELLAPVSGSIELRYSLGTPNFHCIGFWCNVLNMKITGGGWGAAHEGLYSGPALAEIRVVDGVFDSIQINAANSACDGFK